jgi:uncharacterized protein (DUF305 family)
MMSRITLLALLLVVAIPAAIFAQTPPVPAMDHSKMDHSKMVQAASATDSDSTKAFKAANDRMHAEMAIPFTGNADVDFAKGMLPHHQGAVEMAREIIKAQNVEIAFMKKWLADDARKTAKKAN